MSILQDFYQYATENNVLVIPHQIGFSQAVTLKDRHTYAVFFDTSSVDTISVLNTVLAHEQGHCATGALHKVNSPYELVERNEERANRWAIQTYLPFEDLQEAMQNGYIEVWELAEYFNVADEFIEKALTYYTQARQLRFGA